MFGDSFAFLCNFDRQIMPEAKCIYYSDDTKKSKETIGI